MRLGALLAVALWLQVATGSEQVTVETPDGSRLGARLVDAGRGSPGVVFFPMCSPNAGDGWLPVAERLRQAGVSSLLVSYRGTRGNATGNGTGDQRGADADAAVALLRTRIGDGAPLAVAGSSCGVWMALRTAAAHAETTRAVVVLSGPHAGAQIEHVRTTPALAVFSGASAGEPPSPDWARELRAASAHAASRVAILEPRAHGTDLLGVVPGLADELSAWLVARLMDPRPPAPAR